MVFDRSWGGAKNKFGDSCPLGSPGYMPAIGYFAREKLLHDPLSSSKALTV